MLEFFMLDHIMSSGNGNYWLKKVDCDLIPFFMYYEDNNEIKYKVLCTCFNVLYFIYSKRF